MGFDFERSLHVERWSNKCLSLLERMGVHLENVSHIVDINMFQLEYLRQIIYYLFYLYIYRINLKIKRHYNIVINLALKYGIWPNSSSFNSSQGSFNIQRSVVYTATFMNWSIWASETMTRIINLKMNLMDMIDNSLSTEEPQKISSGERSGILIILLIKIFYRSRSYIIKSCRFVIKNMLRFQRVRILHSNNS